VNNANTVRRQQQQQQENAQLQLQAFQTAVDRERRPIAMADVGGTQTKDYAWDRDWNSEKKLQSRLTEF
jgi:hypothetical protein